jgi:hypothetical protein
MDARAYTQLVRERAPGGLLRAVSNDVEMRAFALRDCSDNAVNVLVPDQSSDEEQSEETIRCRRSVM